MKAYVGLGSNLGDRRAHLERALDFLKKLSTSKIRISPVYETQALLPHKAPEDWNQAFLNTVVELETDQSLDDFFSKLQNIEQKMGREKLGSWSPRNIDLDLLEFGTLEKKTKTLTVPHPEISKRNFVVSPLKDISYKYLKAFKALSAPLPQWMKIYNLTPDSFSGDNSYNSSDSHHHHLKSTFLELENNNISFLDLGAESTRPGAKVLTSAKEWQRLEGPIQQFFSYFKDKNLRPQLSVDTYHVETARWALEYGVDIINDVSGLSEPMLELLSSCECQYVLMHSLTVPANPQQHIDKEKDVVEELKIWLSQKLEVLSKKGVELSRIHFDPGIGFGKTKAQSLELLARISEFKDLPVKLLVGHSRKSFLNPITTSENAQRDGESVGVSLALFGEPIDIFRVHDPVLHMKAWKAHAYVKDFHGDH